MTSNDAHPQRGMTDAGDSAGPPAVPDAAVQPAGGQLAAGAGGSLRERGTVELAV